MFVINSLFNVFESLHLCEIITLIFVVIGLIAYGIYYVKFKHIIDVTQNIPSPPSWPIVGHGHYFMFKEPHELLQTIRYLGQKYIEPAKVMKIWLGPELNLLTSDLKDVEIVLGGMTHLDKAGEYKALEPWLREGLLVSRGRKWHQRRKALTPAFHFTILQDFIEHFENDSRVLVTNMDKEYKMQTKEGFDFYEWINLCTLDAVCGKCEERLNKCGCF